MGAWGTGYFEDDTALDFMASLEASSDPKQMIRDAFKRALDSEYLDMDDGSAVTVAAAYVDRQVNNTRFSGVGSDYQLDVDTFPDRHPQIDLSDLRSLAVASLRRVLAEDSEMAELWEESGEADSWREGLEQLAARLER